MYVCICHAVTDRQVASAIADGARTMRDLRQRFGLCSACGKCGPVARQMLTQASAQDATETAVPAEFPAFLPQPA
ncbi:MAG TPA: (2Fe-2S)-binding protein [Gammaproteobacteria bacterium]|nr:(2Fe-2S)-binding protein [Gammaproteobacteria bacterium]